MCFCEPSSFPCQSLSSSEQIYLSQYWHQHRRRSGHQIRKNLLQKICHLCQMHPQSNVQSCIVLLSLVQWVTRTPLVILPAAAMLLIYSVVQETCLNWNHKEVSGSASSTVCVRTQCKEHQQCLCNQQLDNGKDCQHPHYREMGAQAAANTMALRYNRSC